ncbi:uncharacterized protein [Parasteatoda tepidariorum]|uniref:uncharacterized protein n=1 Tax=Parasteatoda tepidariorum TaxID=114398 RepID=UPI00077F9931|nr:L-galactose dehydrogenase-like [Parasteatoda tepidariorum]
MAENEKIVFDCVPTYLKGFHDDILASKMVYSKLGQTQLLVSRLGLGGAQLKDVLNTPKEQDGIDTVIKAVKSGINYFDTAPYYGQGKAETMLGKALKLIPRNTYYLATKVGRYGVNEETAERFDFSAMRTLQSVKESFARLGVNHIDLLQIHDVEFCPDVNIIINETLPALQSLKDAGKISYIGITGYPLSKLREIVEKSKVKIDTVLSYCRCTLLDNELRKYIPFFQERRLGIINAAVLGMGLLTNNSNLPEWHPAFPNIKQICKQAADYCKERDVNLARLAANYSFSQPDIHVHLIGMESEKLVQANLSSLYDPLTAHETEVLNHIIENFYRKIPVTNWENIEPQAYWQDLKTLDLQKLQ